MLRSLNKKYPFNDNLKTNARLIASVSLGIFLFLLFFQPLQIHNPDFNNRLIILATFGAITLVLLSIFRLVIPSLFSTAFSEERWTIGKEILINLLFVISNSVAFVFFARYVGKVSISFHTVIIVVIISISAAVILVVTNQFHLLKKQLEELSPNNQNKRSDYSQKKKERPEITFESENKNENLKLFIDQIMVIKSASNYIEVIYKENERVTKKLIRNTLKATELRLFAYKEIIRCHRSFIINKNYIENIEKGNEGLILTLIGYSQKIHVSRKYILKMKEALNKA